MNGGADDTIVLGILKEGTDFGFGGGVKDVAHDVGNNIDGSIARRGG